MVKVNGKIYQQIEINVNEALLALYEEYKNSSSRYWEYVSQNNLELNEEFKVDQEELNKYLYLVMSQYSQIVGKDVTIIVDGSFNTKNFETNADVESIIKALYHLFVKGNPCVGIAQNDLPSGVYSYFDVSSHGRPLYKYSIIYEGLLAEKVFEALKYLRDNYNNFLQEYNVESLIKEQELVKVLK